MIQIISQPPGDEFTLRLFSKLVDGIEGKKFDAFYLWTSTILEGTTDFTDTDPPIYLKRRDQYDGPVKRHYHIDHIISSIKNDLVILAIKDHLTDGNSFNPWDESLPGLMHHITEIFERHKDKQFILLTSLVNLESYINYKNVKIISWGGDITNQMVKYKTLPNIVEKNLDSDKIFLSLNRNSRVHRTYIISLILGMNIEHKGIMSCMFSKLTNTLDDLGWKFNQSNFRLKKVFNKGYTKIHNHAFDITDEYDIYYGIPNDNHSNFQNNLIRHYQNTFVEIIGETSCTESCFLITEKTQNCFYGCSFPIWISSKGTVAHLRSLGLDVFDDVIDHSYDDIENPIERIYQAVNDNLLILTDSSHVKQLWITHKDRFSSNIEFLQNTFYNNIYEQVTNRFNNSI